jgi:hypothetical protein
MKKYFSFKKISLILAITLLFIQSFRIDKSTKPIDASKDLISLASPGNEVTQLLKTACYDCHSNQPTFPWYTNIAPVSWWIKHHIDEGSHHLNFSEWGTYELKRKNHKLDECVEMLEKSEMPMSSYTWMHSEAKLTDAQRLMLVEWFKGLKENNPSESNH